MKTLASPLTPLPGRGELKLNLLLLAMLIIAIASCSRSKRMIPLNPEFGRYISGYTSGIISKKTGIRVELLNDVPNYQSHDPNKLFSFSPALKGTAVWISSRTVVFTPEKLLAEGEVYDATFHLKKVVKVPTNLGEFPFQFGTARQRISLSVNGLSTPDRYKPETMRLEGKIFTIDFADTNEIKKTVEIVQDGKKLPVNWMLNEYESGAFEYLFFSNSIERKEKPGEVLVNYNGSSVRAEEKGTEKLTIAALGDFNVTNRDVRQSPNQIIQLEFSDPLLVNQNLDGIIAIKGIENLTYEITDNRVNVFLPNRFVGNYVLQVAPGVKNFKGYKMLNGEDFDITLEPAYPQIRLVNGGTIIPNSSELLFPFEAISLKAVDVRISKIFENNVLQFLQVSTLDRQNELRRVAKILVETKIDFSKDKKTNLGQWNRYTIDLKKFIQPDPGAIYRVEVSMRKEYATCDCPSESDDSEENGEYSPPNQLTETRLVADDWNENSWEWGYWSGFDYWNYDDDEYMGNPCDSWYYNGRSRGKNILSSDLGLIVKNGSDKVMHVFVNNLLSTQPMPGVTLEFYDYQKQLLGTTVSNVSGMAELLLKSKPYVLVAKNGIQRGYLRLDDGTSNSLSKFDVAGEKHFKGVKGFIYGERGVWRPGDSLFLSFILEDKQKALPENIPVTFELFNPNNEPVKKIIRTKSVKGLYDFRTVTDPEAVTGNYQARVTVGNSVFSRTVKIETIKPNRLKIYIDFGKDLLSSSQKENKAQLRVKWLHGAIAKNLKAKVDVTVNSDNTSFKGYNGYVFDSPVKDLHVEQHTVFEGNVNENGEAEVLSELKTSGAAPGMLKAYFTTRVFEESGDYSIDRFNVRYSPYTSYVGLRVPESRYYGNMLESGKSYEFDAASVSEEGKPVQKNIRLKIYNIGWRWWWDHDDDELATYLARPGTIVVLDSVIRTVNGKCSFRFKTPTYEYGRYLVTLTDEESGHSTGKLVRFDYPYWARANQKDNENATMLSFSSDKEKYNTGESVKLTVPSSQGNRILVCVENGTRVLKKFWAESTGKETKIEFPATPEMSPNVFVHVTMMQPHRKTKNNTPIRMYGLIPILVEVPATHLYPLVACADVIRPESDAAITVSEKNNQPMVYTLAVVDEGLLDLTRYRAPDPWNTFYSREALGVKTWDLYDMVASAYTPNGDKMLSVGGDGEGDGGRGVKASRFKPVVKFFGPYFLNAGAKAKHNIRISNYVGSVKVMVVAQHNGAYGCTEKAVAIRKPLMVLATPPRVLGPGESLSLPVNVFAMEKNVKDVKIAVQVNGLFKLTGPSTAERKFSEPGDEVVNFRLQTENATGIGKVKVLVSSGEETASTEIEIDVRSANPEVTDVISAVIEPGKSKVFGYVFNSVRGTEKATLEISSMPSVNLSQRLDYLIRYPHGCIEQTTSSVFPQLFVGNITDLTNDQKKAISINIKAGIRRLSLFQTANGGFAYWPGDRYDDEWGSNYAGHFIIEAERLGYFVPASMKSRWIKYQQKKSKEWSDKNNPFTHPHGNESYQQIQAYRLYTLALAQAPELGSMNRFREMNLSFLSKSSLAAAYFMIGREEVAKEMLRDPFTGFPKYKELSHTYGSDTRDKAMLLEIYTSTRHHKQAEVLAQEIAEKLGSGNWWSTQETAYLLIALSRYSEKNFKNGIMEAEYAFEGGSPHVTVSTKPVTTVELDAKAMLKSAGLHVRNSGKSSFHVRLVRKYVPTVGDTTSGSSNLKMEVRYTDLKGTPVNPARLLQGTDFIAEVTISNPGTRGSLNEMALSAIFPAGWEILNSRMDGSIPAVQSDSYDFQDIRDDRVYTYFDVNSNQKKVFRFVLSATYAGRFYQPALYCEAMYDNTINARLPGKWTEVDSSPVLK